MLRTLTKEIVPGVTVTAREPSNTDFYESRKLYKILYDEAIHDEEMKNFIVRFTLIQTRTNSVDGVEIIRVLSTSPKEDIWKSFDEYMKMSNEVVMEWAVLIGTVAYSTVVKKNEEGKVDADPNS